MFFSTPLRSWLGRGRLWLGRGRLLLGRGRSWLGRGRSWLGEGLAFLLLASAGSARTVPTICGTHPDKAREEIHLHRQAQRLRKGPRLNAAALAAANRDIGDIAVIEDTDGVVARRNPFNLTGKTVRFVASGTAASRYRFETKEGDYDEAAAARGTPIAGLEDDDAKEMALPFPFPYFGKTYRSVFVNSDGNFTFGEGDGSSQDRSLGRLTAGPPRIAPLYMDLDPSRAPDSVRVLSDAGRFVVSWVNVPEYREFGTGPLHNFQVRLYPDGRIEFAWRQVDGLDSVVGIAPGRLQGASSIVSFLAGSTAEYAAAVAERFGGSESLDVVTAAQRFYITHEDAYDFLVIFNNMRLSPGQGVVAYELTVRNDRSGYGDPAIDVGADYGSPRRLQSVLNLGPLDQYPTDPNGVVFARAQTRDTPLTILGHEAGHLFLAYVSVRDEDYPGARPMLGRQGFHWDFRFNSEASLLEGNRIRDNGPGATPRFTTVATVEGYAPLDQYLMGLRPAGEVPPTFYVRDASAGSLLRPPQAGVSFDGKRRDVDISEIIQVEGRRTPDHTVAQRRFRLAFILVAPAGTGPSPADLAQVDTYRREFEAAFQRYTSGRAMADTRLRRALRLSVAPAAGVVAGGSIEAAVAAGTPLEGPLAVRLRTEIGAASAPETVTIPAGGSRATFTLKGISAGVEELFAEPADDRFEVSHARVQVASGAKALRVVVVSGNRQIAVPGVELPQPVVFKVTDGNELPYPGLRVTALATGGGRLDRESAVSDEKGEVRFRWTPSPGQVNELNASIDSGVGATATALGRPVISSDGIVNAASFSPRLAAGALATMFGANLYDGRVSIGGMSAQVLFSSDRQLNFLVPLELGPGPADVTVTNTVGISERLTLRLENVAPGIFFDQASGRGAVIDRGEGILEVYATGLGPVRIRADALRETVLRTTALVDGREAEVLFSGLAPGFLGLYQVNVRVPPGARALQLEVDGQRSNVVSVQ